ncbi:MAG: hypothetical protein NT074_03565 [Methanomicrobiales archaeon]|nr:hypothetical protein [Methanomicrobiales archaeon]
MGGTDKSAYRKKIFKNLGGDHYTMQDAEVTQALIDHLPEKKFMALSDLKKLKFSKAFHENGS